MKKPLQRFAGRSTNVSQEHCNSTPQKHNAPEIYSGALRPNGD
jgi:hypothetical protein